ncbi:MAG: flavin reductase family protein [Thermosynechococcaceae cyanobacterium MS004]|nr:flavin reductase family protein [Thermosynechococcaceae cyanobacterium MS004]
MNASIFSLTNPEIYVVTAAYEGQRGGQVATWVTLAAIIPEQLRVIVIISPRNFTYRLMQQSGAFVLNLLAEGQQDWLPLFGLQSMHEVNKFSDIPAQTTESGIPILPETCGWALCETLQTFDLGDRVVFLADVVAQEVTGARQPLRRIEATAALSPEINAQLVAKRLLDIEADRKLRQENPRP